MGALVWFVIAAVLALLELAVGEMTLLMLASGALLTAAVALFGVPVAAEIAVFAVSSVLFWLFLRPPLRKRMESPLVLDETPRALVGSRAEVVEDIDAETLREELRESGITVTAASAMRGKTGDFTDNVVRESARRTALRIATEPVLSVQVVGCGDGEVRLRSFCNRQA